MLNNERPWIVGEGSAARSARFETGEAGQHATAADDLLPRCHGFDQFARQLTDLIAGDTGGPGAGEAQDLLQ